MPYPVVALVGYTNAGKSTLFNRLTGAGVDARDQVFATLDPTMREIALPSRAHAILSDTVGFITDLPTSLVAAFRATLEEVLAADLILHVRDISHPDSEAQRRDVEGVLDELGIGAEERAARLIEVWNKADLLPGDELEPMRTAAARQPGTTLISAVAGTGIDSLLADGATVVAHDPAAEHNARALYGDRVQFFDDAYDAARDADALALVTEWRQYQNPDFERLKQLMARPVLLDGRNIWSGYGTRAMGFTYEGIGVRGT